MAAAREAMTNAAKFGAGAPVDVYAEVDGDRVQVFVRDRGPGFDPGQVPPDRRGVRESIVGRMERHGGHARDHEPARRRHRGGAGAGMSGPRVVIVDDHQLFRAGVRVRAGVAGRDRGRRRLRGGGGRADRRGAARRRAARRAHARRRGRGGDPLGGGRSPRGEVPGAVGVGRRGGRDRGDPRGRARVCDQDDLGRRAGRGRPPRARGRRRLLAPLGRLRARRLRGHLRPQRRPVRTPTPTSTSSPRASARSSSTSRAGTCTRRSPTASTSRPRRSRRTCRRCCASCSSRAGTSCRGGRRSGGWSRSGPPRARRWPRPGVYCGWVGGPFLCGQPEVAAGRGED